MNTKSVHAIFCEPIVKNHFISMPNHSVSIKYMYINVTSYACEKNDMRNLKLFRSRQVSLVTQFAKVCSIVQSEYLDVHMKNLVNKESLLSSVLYLDLKSVYIC